MTIKTERLEFRGATGATLAARLDRPMVPPRAYALFAHCFTCSKDLFAVSRIAEGLAAEGIAVLRFDFTGLGSSEGEFANTDFSSNVGDLIAAADFLRSEYAAPEILVGHSFGGTAVLAAAQAIPEAKAVATIGAPFDPGHVRHLLKDSIAEIERTGRAEVELAGRSFRIEKGFLDDIAEQRMGERLAKLGKALLVFHAPLDDQVGIENATEIFSHARHPKSFVSLDGADHLLTDRADAVYVAGVLAAWSARYVPLRQSDWPEPKAAPDEVVVAETREGTFPQVIAAGPHRLRADEPESYGGFDSGPTPYGLLLAGLGACTSMTMRLYANRKEWPVERFSVRLRHENIHAEDCEDCESREGMVALIEREITIEGDLDDEQRASLMRIADRCPVHRTLTHEIRIRTHLAEK
ncbi:MAG: osmotically inducible protein C [Rhodospirillaceae bacterium]|mgnify:CR=1 FL=1|nr:osmotically inducible protein C [Rhodospirillaceae bacterium]